MLTEKPDRYPQEHDPVIGMEGYVHPEGRRMIHTPGGAELPGEVDDAGLKARKVFAKGLHPYKLVWIFTAGCILGYIVEMLFCMVYHGKIETRQGLIYGPFSQIYGIGAVLMTVALSRMSHRRKLDIFLLCALIGGMFEFSCSVIQEVFFHSRSWDFSDQTFHFGGRTSLMFMSFWGMLGIFFVKIVYPRFSGWVERVPYKAGMILTWGLILFFTFNITLSATAVRRWSRRQEARPATSAYEVYLDQHFPDSRMQAIYPQIQFVAE